LSRDAPAQKRKGIGAFSTQPRKDDLSLIRTQRKLGGLIDFRQFENVSRQDDTPAFADLG